MPDPRWLERLSGITAETLVVVGGPRSHVPQDGIVELARRVPGGRVVTIPVGHLIHHAAPEEFTEAVSTKEWARTARPAGPVPMSPSCHRDCSPAPPAPPAKPAPPAPPARSGAESAHQSGDGEAPAHLRVDGRPSKPA
ncbi:alpha/beta fold hydrolase [Streptomyces sp. NPDC060064]|uniref:alpha/beta fold hydrolase n=1 Tax=Streptomyces sp. NPDC060064 TaxID=3347049 RepID=UPI0036AC0E10